MRPKAEISSLVLCLLVLLLASGCAENRAAHFLWPDLDDPYSQVVRDWTRTGSIYSGLETEFLANATLKSNEWRQAYVDKKAQVYSLTPKDRQYLEERLKASSQTETEIFLSVFSPITEQSRIIFNDPLWSIFIEHGDQRVLPLETRHVRQPLAKTRVFYPYVRQWRQNYILRFPLPTPDAVVMVMSGPLGRIELEW